ncbi:hypothetical protein [Desulfomonile tiedjei]|uniref:Uncharacterized protein n=1 Tax=Desulfomonile tiedjei (strain ATCC 49306 / DSM 6799 / DCB-1) TaxID=706587 RepID=I4C412_DESTA|nr:hypothetical protein [Desulfomonile tiedjei]AFM24303.1 hypothetical protein Desti_1592 [Desulfomonile tiedjei DSM 6799]
MKKSVILLVILILATASTALCEPLNPYLPMNAVAAEPMDPYNLNEIPMCSEKLYLPCPSPIPFSAQFPDIPPLQVAFRGVFGCPVPVP